MADAAPVRAAAAAAAAILGVLAGCADNAGREENDLKTILVWLPGLYETAPERGPSAGLALVIAPIYTPQFGKGNFYLQEVAADNPNRVMTERIVRFKNAGKLGILSTFYSFNEPLRWRNGQENPLIFNGLQPEDVHSTPGCELSWTRVENRFTGRFDPTRCASAPAASAAVYQLTPETLTLGGYEFHKIH